MVTRRNSRTASQGGTRTRQTRNTKKTIPAPDESKEMSAEEASPEPAISEEISSAGTAEPPEEPVAAPVESLVELTVELTVEPSVELSAESPVKPVAELSIEPPVEPFAAQIEAPEEEPMSTPEVIDATATASDAEANKGGAIAVREQFSLSIWNRPVMPSDIEVVGEIQSSGIRPIEASHLAVFGTILNGRPILSSNLKVAEMLPGNRPIFFSDFQSVSALTLSGDRPVMASAAGLMTAEKLPGDRPIFSNDIDNPLELMGYID